MEKKTTRKRVPQNEIDNAKLGIIKWHLNQKQIEEVEAIMHTIKEALNMSGRDAINLAKFLKNQKELPLDSE